VNEHRTQNRRKDGVLQEGSNVSQPGIFGLLSESLESKNALLLPGRQRV
jgi:hypothetical protein